jgi:hypothetical protein
MRHTSDHVIEQLLVCVPGLKLCLPSMMMSVDEAWTDDLVGTINNLGIFRRLNVVINFCNLAILNQEAGNGWCDVVIMVMNEDGAISENDAGGNHFCECNEETSSC